ncbi:MAG: hypothetical protein ACM33V_09045 [Chloroflexota bacterium]|nr:hypothetical protein [Anaerolineales bacterium]
MDIRPISDQRSDFETNSLVVVISSNEIVMLLVTKNKTTITMSPATLKQR